MPGASCAAAAGGASVALAPRRSRISSGADDVGVSKISGLSTACRDCTDAEEFYGDVY